MPTSMRGTMSMSGSGSRRGDLSAATSSSSPHLTGLSGETTEERQASTRDTRVRRGRRLEVCGDGGRGAAADRRSGGEGGGDEGRRWGGAGPRRESRLRPATHRGGGARGAAAGRTDDGSGRRRETGEEREAFGRTAGSAGDAWSGRGPAAADGARSGKQAWRSGGEDEINWEGDRA